MRIRPYLTVRPRAGCVARLVIIVALSLAAVAVLRAQVPTTITLTGGSAASIIRNPSRDTVTVTVALHFGSASALGRLVRAQVSPSSFTLAPTETQTFRVRLRESVARGTVLRVLTCFLPVAATQPAPGSKTQAVTRLFVRTCVNAKAVVA